MKNISINLPLKKSDRSKLLLASKLSHETKAFGLFGDKSAVNSQFKGKAGSILWTKTSEVDAVISRLSDLGLNANVRTVWTPLREFSLNMLKSDWIIFLAYTTLLVSFALSVYILLKEVPMRDDPILWGVLSLVIIMVMCVAFRRRFFQSTLTSSKTLEASFEILESCNYNANSAKFGNHLVSIFSAPVEKHKVRIVLLGWGIASFFFVFGSLFAPLPFRGFCVFISVLFIVLAFLEKTRSEDRELIWSCTKERLSIEDGFSPGLILDLEATNISGISNDGDRIIISYGEMDNFSFKINDDSESVARAVFWANDIIGRSKFPKETAEK